MVDPWLIHGERVALETAIFDVKLRDTEHPSNGHRGEFVTIASRDWVNVVAVTADDRVVLVRQFRHGTQSVTLEIPGGIVDAGEDVVSAGLRELREETGFDGPSGRVIHWVHPNPAFMDNRCSTVLVERCAPSSAQELDAGEDIEVVLASRLEIERWILDGTITHSMALNGLFAWLLVASS